MAAANTTNSVVAKLWNQASFEEGLADGALMPGQGCVLYEDAAGEKRVRAAGGDELTTRVVREARNPPRGQGVAGESVMAQGYDAGETVETIGFNRHDQARCIHAAASTAAVGDVVGWNADGELSTTTDGTAAVTENVARIRKILTDVYGTTDIAVVAFL